LSPAPCWRPPRTRRQNYVDVVRDLAARIGPIINGITDREIRFGMVLPSSGARKEAGRQMKIGIETAFNRANDTGGISGRALRLFTADDGYEPSRTLNAMKQLHEKDQVFGFIGNIGTATAAVAIPYALERRACSSGRSRVPQWCGMIRRTATSSVAARATRKRPARWFAIR
jgi:ABC-type branched-subunit amino acid transport system substrate-binding protein